MMVGCDEEEGIVRRAITSQVDWLEKAAVCLLYEPRRVDAGMDQAKVEADVGVFDAFRRAFTFSLDS